MKKILDLIVPVCILVILAVVLSQYWPVRIVEEERGELEADTEKIAEIPEGGMTQTGVSRVVIPGERRERKIETEPRGLRIEPGLYLYRGNPLWPETLVKVGPPTTEVPVRCGMILELNINNINPSKSHTIKTFSFSTYEDNYDPKPNEWSIWGTLEYQERIPAGVTEYQVNIAGTMVGLAGHWVGKKKVEIYWDEELIKTFFFDTVPRTE